MSKGMREAIKPSYLRTFGGLGDMVLLLSMLFLKNVWWMKCQFMDYLNSALPRVLL